MELNVTLGINYMCVLAFLQALSIAVNCIFRQDTKGFFT